MEENRNLDEYSKGNNLEDEFIKSWDFIEDFYKGLDLYTKPEILLFIKHMRTMGFDKTLRAGQSLYTMILSRAGKHGLREDQNRISFSFHYLKSMMEVKTRKGEKITFDNIKYNDTIGALLKTLELQEIN